MNTKTISFFVGGLALALILVIFFSMKVSYNNGYTDLETQASARQNVSKITFDSTWKIIQGQAQVATKERESFKNVFVDIMNSRVANEQQVIMKWSQEAQIPISADLYKILQNSIESQRSKFLEAQKELIDIQREANKMKHTFPGSFFLGGRKDIMITIVTSDKTDEVFKTGKENNVDVFEK